MDVCRVIEGRAWRSEGTEANHFNPVYGSWPWAGNFFERSLKPLEIAGHYQPQTLLPYIRTVAVCTVRDHPFVRPILRACWHEDLYCLISLKIKRRLSRPARERILGSIESCPAEDRYKANFPFNALGIGTRAGEE